MTTADCNHFTVDDDEPYCGQCQDLFYLDTEFELNGHEYRVWQFYGHNAVTWEANYQCRRTDGNGSIVLSVTDIDGLI